VIDALELPVRDAGPGGGTGPFYVTESGESRIELAANENYHFGKPVIQRISIRPYSTLRAAWADMLRGEVDMLYEIGVDALDFVKPSKSIQVYEHQRNYADVVLFNVQKPFLKDRVLRQSLNAAIDRNELVMQILGGHGAPAESALWPQHWAYDTTAPKFQYDPKVLKERLPKLSCLFADQSLERLALAVQRQLQAVGVDVGLEFMPIDALYTRVQSGEFDLVLADALLGPNILRPYQFWYPGSTNNWGRYNNAAVSTALDRVRHARDDDEYRTGVSLFQRAMFDDPPAIFLAWTERARAVSSRFEVPVEPGRDVLGTLRLWRPAADKQTSPD
jgi:peptide/nickel transport system substrate-binding protein